MTMKKMILLFMTVFILSGCMKAIESATGIEITKNTNPVMEMEMDLVFLDELAALTKLNQIILERIPISLDDSWPSVLNDYSATPREGEAARYEDYKNCLTNLLKRDFAFYSIYNPKAYFRVLTGQSTGVQALLAQGLIAARNTLIMDGAEEMGRKFEHGKWVISYYPFSCKCPFYSPRFQHLKPGSPQCRNFAARDDCPFFSRPTEEILSEYFLQEGGLDAWEDLKISPDCLRIVEGEKLGPFKTVFYTLFPDHIRDEAARVDSDLEATESELKTVQARLKEENLSSGEEARLEKEEEALEDAAEELIAVQEKLYETALSTLEPTPEKIIKAKKLLEITQFIREGFDEISTAMFALTVKMTDDMIVFSRLGAVQFNNDSVSLTTQGVASQPMPPERARLMTKRMTNLPVNYASILGYAMSQKSLVSEYSDYLEAVAAMEKKMARQ
ncbi:conserved hypothetical protein [delta proteobacterium NaphS2]|nr:conserved hypothetical protein [delta proteobacterium NaphS2]